MLNAFLRRAIDIVGAVVGLVCFAVPMSLVAMIIRASSPGPAIFRQKRVGKNGKVFLVYKFRTMRTNVDPYGFSPRDEEDPRITHIGRFLRKYSLDELPQFVNVLQGDMSLVGPRPLLSWQYEKWTDHQRRRCDVKPGLTGWAQIHGRGAVTHEDKIELDIWYVDRASLWLDIKIILKTIGQAVHSENILEVRYSRDETAGKDRQDNV
jgi:lipopolysaccharide/colanic/teichoic acid biosynthesis glycosyltransferase